MATYYWRGGTGTWDNTSTTNWSTSSGGAGGAGPPLNTDTVIFDTASAAANYTVTVAATAVSLSATVANPTGGVVTLSLSGSPTLCTAAGTFTFTSGTIDLNNNTLSVGIFSSSNTNTRTINFGSGSIALTSTTAATTVLAMATATNFTWTGTGGFTRNQAATATVQVGSTAGGSSTTAPNLTVNAGASTLTITTGSSFKDVNFTGSTSTVTATYNAYGNLTLATGGTYTSVAPTFRGSGTITTNGKTISNLVVNGTGITVTLGGAVTASAGNGLTLTAGTLDLAGFTYSVGLFVSSNTNTRAIAFGSGSISLTFNGTTTILDMATTTNFTWTGTGGFTRNQISIATVQCSSTAGTAGVNFSVTAGASTLNITTNSRFNNLVFTGSTSSVTGAAGGATTINLLGNLTLASGGTYTSVLPVFIGSGTVTSSGKTLGSTTVNGSGITVTLADAMTLGAANTFTLTQGTLALANFTLSTGIFSSNNSNTRAISFGSGNIALTSTTASTTILVMDDATNFSRTGTGGFTRNQAATATIGFGVAGGTTANAPNLTVNAGVSTLVIKTGSYLSNVNFTGSTCAVTGVSGNNTLLNICGNLTLGPSIFTNYTTVRPAFLTSGTITSNGQKIGFVTIDGAGITVTLADALSLANVLDNVTLTQGTFDAASFNVTAYSFSSSNTNTRTVNMGSGTWTLNQNWNTGTSTNLTVNPGTSTVRLSASFASFAGGGKTYYNLVYDGTGTLIISGSNSFNNITNFYTPVTLSLTAGTTQTVSNFSFIGLAGFISNIRSNSTGVQATLSKTSGSINTQYLSIQDSAATGGANWYVFNGKNEGNNSGWIFNNNNGFGMLLVP